MRKAISLFKLRIHMMFHMIKRYLTETPGYISLIVVVPLILFFFIEVMIPNSIELYAINPNIIDLVKSFSVMFHQLLFYTILMAAPIYIFISQINIRSYDKYKNLNISFKDISIANILLFLLILNILLVTILALFLIHTASTLVSSIIAILMILLSIDSIIITLYVYYQIITVLVFRITQTRFITLLELGVVVLCTLSVFYPVKYMPFQIVMSTPFLFTIIFMIVVLSMLCGFYKKLTIHSSFIIREVYRKNAIINIRGDINIFKNYALLLYQSKAIYIEYIISFCIFILFVQYSNLSNLMNDIIFQLLIPLFLISNGIIYAYKKWFLLRSKKAFVKLLGMDMIFSLVMLLIIYIVLSYLLFQKVNLIDLLSGGMTYMVLNFMQSKLQFEYKMDSKSPISFILLYGSASFLVYTLLAWGLSYV